MVTLQLNFTNSADWRNWLSINHKKNITVWLEFYKKKSGKMNMKYEDAVSEALCFGWIDSIIKRVNEEIYVRKFTLRNDSSYWSEINKKRVVELIKEKRMTPAGLKKIKAAQKNGRWNKVIRSNLSFKVSDEFMTALYNNIKAKNYFENLAPTYKKQYTGWINSAKMKGTKLKRIKISIKLLTEGKRLGLK